MTTQGNICEDVLQLHCAQKNPLLQVHQGLSSPDTETFLALLNELFHYLGPSVLFNWL